MKKAKRNEYGNGHLYKRDNKGKEHPITWTGRGNFYLGYYVDGKRIRQRLVDDEGKPITSKGEAEATARRILAPYQTGSDIEALKAIKARLEEATQDHAAAVEESKGGLQIIDTWQKYLDSKKRPKSGEATLRQYGFQWIRFESWILAHPTKIKTVDQVKSEHAEEYATDLINAKLTGNTINKHISLLSLVFRTLADAANITINPWEKITKHKQPSNGRRELTTEELRRISQAADNDLKLLFALGCYTGLRLGDCATLLWSEVDLDQGFIIRVPNKTASSGKPVRVPLFRDLAAMLRDARTSATGEYVIPELAELYEAGRVSMITDRVQRHFLNCGIDCHAKGTGQQIKRDKKGNPEFNEYGNAILEPTGKRAVVRCGFHSLRHTFVSLCRQANAPLSVVESIVGHSNPAMTRHYSHVGDEEAAKAIAALPAMNATETPQARPQPPQWVTELIKTMTADNWQKVKNEILRSLDKRIC